MDFKINLSAELLRLLMSVEVFLETTGAICIGIIKPCTVMIIVHQYNHNRHLGSSVFSWFGYLFVTPLDVCLGALKRFTQS